MSSVDEPRIPASIGTCQNGEDCPAKRGARESVEDLTRAKSGSTFLQGKAMAPRNVFMLKPHPGSAVTRNGSSRRKVRRASVRCAPFRLTPCYLSAPAQGIGASAWVYNISAVGAGILGSPWIAPDTILTVELINAGHTYALAVEMQVTRIEAVKTGNHYLGGQFVRKL